jgi:DegV family protein with EDD domain
VNGLHIVLDSTANVPADLLAANANLHVVPLTVSLGGRQWLEWELTNAELFGEVQTSRLYPKTSQPSPGDFAKVFAALTKQGGKVIAITLAGGLSGTPDSARAAARLVGEKDIIVIDSGTTAAGMVRLAKIALAAAARGETFTAVADRLDKLSQANRTMFVPDTLEYLHKGGRIGGAAALLGSILQIRPVLYLAGGKVAVLDKVRTRRKAVARMLDELIKCGSPAYVDVVQIEAADEAVLLKAEVERFFPEAEVTVTSGGAVLAAHLGPGLLGLIYSCK